MVPKRFTHCSLPFPRDFSNLLWLNVMKCTDIAFFHILEAQNCRFHKKSGQLVKNGEISKKLLFSHYLDLNT